jgi:hypothetical protein
MARVEAAELQAGRLVRAARAPASALPGRAFVVALLALLSVLIVLPVLVLVIGSFLTEPPRALHFDWSGATFAT